MEKSPPPKPWKSRVGGAAVVLLGLAVLTLEATHATRGGWLWWIIGGFAILLGLLNVLGIGRTTPPTGSA